MPRREAQRTSLPTPSSQTSPLQTAGRWVSTPTQLCALCSGPRELTQALTLTRTVPGAACITYVNSFCPPGSPMKYAPLLTQFAGVETEPQSR